MSLKNFSSFYGQDSKVYCQSNLRISVVDLGCSQLILGAKDHIAIVEHFSLIYTFFKNMRGIAIKHL